jgi:PAS domain S-box-containing protein
MVKPKPAPKAPETLAAPPSCETCPSGRAHMAEERFRAVFNSVSDGIWVCDGAGRILEINPASERLNSIQAGDYIGKDVQCILKEGLVDRSVTLDVLKNKHQASLIQHIKKSGKHLLVTGTPAFDQEGNISLVVVNERDVTELNTLRESLQQARKVQEKYRSELAELSMLELDQKDIVGQSPEMKKVLNALLKLAHMDASRILLLGESGTGKGLLAKFLHRMSPRADKPFIHINCPALPENLFEAELFGYERGAFTGAREQGKAGLIELALGGTLFLDELGDIPQSVQAKLLKYLDDHEIMRLGGNQPKKVECCVVAATNRNIERLVEQKRFRRDLFYRLNTFTVRIAPLRERKEDIFGLAEFYLKHFNTRHKKRRRLSLKAVRLLEHYDYPGNVRELVGIIQKAYVMSEEEDITAALKEAMPGAAGEAPGQEPRSLPGEVAAANVQALRKAMAACHGTREMARYLGVSQSTVVRKLKRYGLSPD